MINLKPESTMAVNWTFCLAGLSRWNKSLETLSPILSQCSLARFWSPLASYNLAFLSSCPAAATCYWRGILIEQASRRIKALASSSIRAWLVRLRSLANLIPRTRRMEVVWMIASLHHSIQPISQKGRKTRFQTLQICATMVRCCRKET